MTREEKIMGKRLKALIDSGETGFVKVQVAQGRIVGVEQGTDAHVATTPSTVMPIDAPRVPVDLGHVPPLTTRDEESRG